MASRSPQVIIRERDQSSYPATSSDTIVAIIGFATKGPINEAVELSGRNAFEDTFGSIPKNAPWGHMAAYKAFREGRVIYYRVANDDATGAEVVIQNAQDETEGYQEFSRDEIIDYGEYETDSTYEFQVTIDDASEPKTIEVTSPETGDWELNKLASDINDALIEAYDGESEGATASLEDDKIRIKSDSTGTSSKVLIEEVTDGTNEDLVDLLDGVDDAVDGEEKVEASDTDNILFRAKEKGTDTNKIAVSKDTSHNDVEDRDVITISVWFDEEEIETFEDVSLDPSDDDFFGRLMNRDKENDGSGLVEVDYDDKDEDDGDLEFPDGEYKLGEGNKEYSEDDTLDDYDYRKGHDGAPESGGAGLFKKAMGSDSDLANADKFNFHILLTPDNGSQTTQNAAISLAESRKDFFYIADPPFGLSYTDVTDWHNGSGGHGRDAALNSSFAAVYWPWLKDMNPRDDEYLWCPPSVFLGEKLLQVDSNYAPWYAPAGDLRGRLVANDTETSPSLNQRDFMYARPNAVNPIVNFSTKGIVIYGQKTTLRQRSALDRVNVRRMAIYATKLIKESMEGMLFEPHIPDSWARATDFVNRILEPIRRDNGLEDYQVIIDGSTNDQDAIANGVMKGIIKLVPVNAIEVVDLTITFLSPGVSIE